MAYNYQQMPTYYGQQQPMFPNGNASPDMLNQYKGQYQPQMQMPQQMTQQPIQSQVPNVNNDFLWVLGEVEAVSYPVAANNTVILWDKNQQTIYIKSANAQGIPSMRILDYSDRTAEPKNEPPQHECQCGKNFVHIDDFNALKADFEALTEKINNMTAATKTKATKKEKEAE